MGGLTGKAVALTRPEDQCRDAAAAIEALGGDPRCYPLLKIEDRSAAPDLQSAVAQRYDWLVFTSANGVRAYVAARRRAGLAEGSATRALCVGEKTALTAQEAGLEAVLAPDVFAADRIPPLMADAGVQGASVLLVRGNLADAVLPDALQRLGCAVVDAVGYATLPSGNAATLARDVLAGKLAAVTFASGSAVDVFFAALPEPAPSQVVLAALGPKTAAVVREHGSEPHVVAPQATMESLAFALASYFEKCELSGG